MRNATRVASIVLLIGCVVPMPANAAMASDAAAMPFDFDGDGYADLAVGVRGEGLRSKPHAGAVQVLYGSASGLTDHDQFWHQGRKGVKGAVEAHDRFGSALDSGDFDADGYADLAIGIPREDLGGVTNAGAVQVLYGSPEGLTAAGDQLWHQGTKGVPGANQKHDRFGEVLAVGDFDGDGFADLAVGVGGEDLGGDENVGRVAVLRGSPAGLTADGAQSWNQASPGIASTRRHKERFGYHLAAGDVTADGRDDLLVQTFREWDSSLPGNRASGNRGSALHLLLGTSGGLTATGSQYLNGSDLGVAVTWTFRSLWLGDVDADGHDDVALGGYQVFLLHGHADGFHPGPLAEPGEPGRDTVWPEASLPVSGDFTGDGHVDLALMRYWYCSEHLGPGGCAPGTPGLSMVIGTADGLGSEVVRWQPTMGATDFSYVLGLTLNVLPLSGGTHAWLVVGTDDASVGAVATAGNVTLVRADGPGLPGEPTTWSQDSPKIKNVAEQDDLFGTVGNRWTHANP